MLNIPVEVLFDEFKLDPNEAGSKERGQETTEIEVMMGSLMVGSMDTSLEEAKESISLNQFVINDVDRAFEPISISNEWVL
jgi:hypothetical protein